MPIMTIIHKDKGKWWYWRAGWAERAGPFDTREEAEQAWHHYCAIYIYTIEGEE